MRRFTFGCSFTQYNWPTWADLYGLEGIPSFNWGCAGLGNRAIAERVAECNVKSKFTPDDTVIVQWSSHFRHDWMHTRSPIDDVSLWRTSGSIFSPKNQQIFDRNWLLRFWDEKAYYIHTLNSIALVQGLLEASGCTWYMTSLNDLTKIGNSVDQKSMYGDFHNPERQMMSVWDIEHSLLDYKEQIWDKYSDHWIGPMTDFRDTLPNLDWYFKLDPSRDNSGIHEVYDGKFKESHMSMDQHALFLNVMKSKMGYEPVLNNNQQTLVDEINLIKNNSETYDEFLNSVKQSNWGTTLVHKGF